MSKLYRLVFVMRTCILDRVKYNMLFVFLFFFNSEKEFCLHEVREFKYKIKINE